MRAYSDDLRIRIIKAYQNHEGSQRQLARRFAVSLSFLENLLKQFRQTGSIEPKPHGGGCSPKIDAFSLQAISEWVENNPDTSLKELCRRLDDTHRIRVSRSTMCRALKRLNLVLQKRRSTRYATHLKSRADEIGF